MPDNGKKNEDLINTPYKKGKFSNSYKSGDFNSLKAENNPNQIDQNEAVAFDIIKKYDALKDLNAFKDMINKSNNKQVKQDALTLEESLLTAGMTLTADGVITDKTIAAIESLVSKNTPAIKAYKEATGINIIRK